MNKYDYPKNKTNIWFLRPQFFVHWVHWLLIHLFQYDVLIRWYVMNVIVANSQVTCSVLITPKQILAIWLEYCPSRDSKEMYHCTLLHSPFFCPVPSNLFYCTVRTTSLHERVFENAAVQNVLHNKIRSSTEQAKPKVMGVMSQLNFVRFVCFESCILVKIFLDVI